MGPATGEKPAARGPRRGELLEVEIDSLAFGGRGVARADGFVVFVSGALPGDRVRVEVTKAKKRFAEARTVELLRAGAERIPDRLRPRRRALPRRALAGPPLRAPARPQERAGRRGAAADRRPRGLRAGGDRPRRSSSGATATSSNTPSATRRGRRADPRLPRPRPLGPGRRRRRLPPRLRGRQRRPQRGPRVGAAGVGAGLRPPRSAAACCATWSSARAGARGQIQTRLVTAERRFPKPPVDLHTIVADDSGDSEGPTGVLGEEYLREELCGLKWEISPGAFFQTNTEMAERLYAVAAEYAGLSGTRAGLRPLLRDRHDRPDDGRRGGRGLGPGDRPRGDRGRRAQRRAERDRERPLPRRQRPHRRAAAARAGRQARRRRHRPAPGRPLAEDGAAGDRVRGEADRLRLLQPDHARPQRRPAGRGRL